MAPKRKSGQVQQQQKQKSRKKAHKESAPKVDPKDLYEASESDAEEEKYAYKFDVSMPSSRFWLKVQPLTRATQPS